MCSPWWRDTFGRVPKPPTDRHAACSVLATEIVSRFPARESESPYRNYPCLLPSSWLSIHPDPTHVTVANDSRQAYKSLTMQRLKAFAFATIPLFLSLASCTHAVHPNQSVSENLGTATFVATEHRFEGPDMVPAGNSLIRMRNQGREAHHIQLVKLESGHTLMELVEALRSPIIQIPAWAKQVGGPNAVESGDAAEAPIDLDAGHYAMLCLVPTNDGTPHVVLGMYKALEVVGPASSSLLESTFPSDYHLVMADYEFTMVEAPAAGRHTFRVVNRGTHPHEASLVRLGPHATVEDVLASFAPGTTNTLPGTLLGGVAGLEPNREGVFTATLSPGRYGVFCLFPNPHHETSHVRRGMVLMFTVD